MSKHDKNNAHVASHSQYTLPNLSSAKPKIQRLLIKREEIQHTQVHHLNVV